MRRLWGLSLLALVIALLSLGSAAAQGGDELLVNGNFAQGTAGWTFNIASTCGSCWIDVLGDDSGPERNMLMWERTNSGNNGSAIWAQQRVDADVSRYGSLWLTVQLRVLQHSLSNSGWWSDMHNGNGEYPVQVTLRFADRGGQLFEWSHGFLAVHDGSTALRNYTLVPAGEWTTYSADLFLPAEWTDPRGMALPTAARLVEVVIGGSGWDFSGAIKSISIMGSPSQGGGSGGTGGQTGGTGGQTGGTVGFIVEEYPLVSAAEDQPDHYEFRQRVTEQILAVRRAWREPPDLMAAVAEVNEIIGQWGYSLRPFDEIEPGGPKYRLMHLGNPLITDITYVWPIAVNSDRTDFRLLLDSWSEPTLVVTPDTVGYVDDRTFVYIPPVYVGNDLYEVVADWNAQQFHVTRNGQIIYTVTPTGPFVEPPVKALWAWEWHWVLEVAGDVLIDGQSLRQQLGYEEIFEWRLIDGLPFFFFKRDGRYGLHYGGQIVEPYRYDDIVHYLCCEPGMFNAAGNDTMVWFYALRDGVWHYVEAGVYR
jgi:hypothetical protein